MGLANESFEGSVIEILNLYVPDLGEGAIVSRHSKNGKYLAITATLNARSQIQLDSLYLALNAEPQVLMVL